MAYTLKDLAATAQIVTQEALERSFIELKNYIDARDLEGKEEIQSQLDALIGADGGDVDKLLNTFNDIKAFLAAYSEDDTLKSLFDAVNTAIGNEKTRAEGVERQLSERITTLENISVMTDSQAKELFDSVFYDDSSSSSE